MTKRWKTWVIVLGLVAAVAASAQTPRRSRAASAAASDYFPLAVGNSWTYLTAGTTVQDSLTVQVTFAEQFNGRTYFQLEGFTPAPAWVRLTDSGQLVEWDAESRRDRLWYEFQAPEGAFWQPQIPDECVGMATLASRRAEVDVPVGGFRGALEIEFGPTQCADAGIEREFFAPGIGLLQRTVTTIAGPRTFVLSRLEVGGQIWGGPALTISLSLDRPAYQANLMPPVDSGRAIPRMRAAFMIRNASDVPLILTFPSGQQFDVIVRNEAGDVVYHWSEGRLFTQAVTTLELSPGQRTFAVEIPLSAGSRPLPPGDYVAEAWLTTVKPVAYRASLPFTMLEPVF